MLRCVLALAVLASVAYAQIVKYYAYTSGIMAIANVNADTMNIQVVSSSSILTLTVTAYGNETIYTKDYSANERSAKISDIKLTSSQKTALQTQNVLFRYSIQGASRSTPFILVGQYASSIDSVPSSSASALAFISGSNLYLTSTADASETPLAIIRATPGCTGRAAAVCTSYPCTVSSLDYSGSNSYYIDISKDAISAVYASGTLVSTKNTTFGFVPNACDGTETGSPSSPSDSSGATVAIVVIVILVVLCCVCCIGVAIGIGVCWWQKSKSKNANAYNTVQSPTSPTVVVQGSNSVVMQQAPVVAPQPVMVQQHVAPQPSAQQRQPSMPQQQYPPQQAFVQQQYPPQNIPMQQGYQQMQPQQYPPQQQGSVKMHYAPQQGAPAYPPQQGAPVYAQQPPPQYMQQQPPQRTDSQVKTPDV